MLKVEINYREINDLIAKHITNMQPLRPGASFWCRYSTDIHYAWEVVRKMKLKDFHSAHKDLTSKENGERWEWSFEKENNLYTARAETAPLAICLAALKAFGIDEVE